MQPKTQLDRLSVIVKAGVTYFGLVFGVGFLLGTLRVLFLAPRLGERLAELMETPLMLVVIIFAATWIVRRFKISGAVATRIAIGLIALILLVGCEFTIVLWLRGLTLTEYFRERDPVTGTVYYLMLIVFAAMPLLVRRKSVVVNG